MSHNRDGHCTKGHCIKGHQELPEEVQRHILSFLPDEQKLELVNSFPWILNLVKTFTLDFDVLKTVDSEASQERLQLFRQCPNVSKVIIREEESVKGSIENCWDKYPSFMKTVADMNPGLKWITFEQPSASGPSREPIHRLAAQLSRFRLDYILQVLKNDPSYDGHQFKDPLILDWRLKLLQESHPELSLNKILIYDVCFYENDPEENSPALRYHQHHPGDGVTEVCIPFLSSREVVPTIRSHPNVSKIELTMRTGGTDWKGKNVLDWTSIMTIKTLDTIVAFVEEASTRNVVTQFWECHTQTPRTPREEGNLKGILIFQLGVNRRVFQVTNHLLIVTSRFKLPFSVRWLIEFFPNVSKVVYEVYQEEEEAVTQQEIQTQVEEFNECHSSHKRLIVFEVAN